MSETAPIIIPLDDDLLVHLYRHSIPSRLEGSIPCMTFISKGLATFGQKEVVWTIRDYSSPPSDGSTPKTLSLPTEVIQWYMMLLEYSKKGQIVHAYGFTDFASQSFFGRADVGSVVYMPSSLVILDGLPSGALPEARLHAIVLTTVERKAHGGLLRILSRLGHQTRYYPFPPWWDDQRPSIWSDELQSSTLLAHAGRTIQLSGLSATRRRSAAAAGGDEFDVVLYIRPGAADMLKQLVEAYPPSSAVGLEMELHEYADSCLTWMPELDPEAVHAIGAGDSPMDALGACFILFIPQQDSFRTSQMEDGYAVFITDELWTAVRDAFVNRTSVRIPPTPGDTMSLQVVWVDDAAVPQPHDLKLTLDAMPWPRDGSSVFVDQAILRRMNPSSRFDILSVGTYLGAAVEELRRTIPANAGADEHWVLVTVPLSKNPLAADDIDVLPTPDDGAVDIKLIQNAFVSQIPQNIGDSKLEVTLRLWRREANDAA